MKINISENRQKVMVEKVQEYFRKEHEETIGELKAGLMVDFFIKELGPQIYNQAIDDAHSFMQDKLIDLESILYIPE